jgi:elongation factor 1-gamma
MSLTLHTYPGNFRAFKILVAAQCNGIEIDVPEFEMMKDNATPEFLAKAPLGKVPVLETKEGCIFESNAIARYVARMRRDTEIYGATFFESAQIDSWIDFCAHELELPATMWFYPVFGYMPFNAAATAKAKEDLNKALATLDAHLLHRTYLVGDTMTLADITVASALIYPMKMLLDAGARKPFNNVTRWFTLCVNQPAFAAVVGEVTLCKKTMKAEGDDGKDAAPAKGKGKAQQQPKKEKKAAAPAPAPAPKVEKKLHPLAQYLKDNKPSIHIDTWKACYKNSKHDGPDGYANACDKFWDMIDKEHYSVWICDYPHKDHTALWMTSNAIGGFCDRMEEVRKFAMGTMAVSGAEGAGNIFVKGAWVIVGQKIDDVLECNADAEYYTWTKLEWDNAAHKQMVKECWASGLETDVIDGRPYYDSKVFV